jgi:hypothetical protein
MVVAAAKLVDFGTHAKLQVIEVGAHLTEGSQ